MHTNYADILPENTAPASDECFAVKFFELVKTGSVYKSRNYFANVVSSPQIRANNSIKIIGRV